MTRVSHGDWGVEGLGQEAIGDGTRTVNSGRDQGNLFKTETVLASQLAPRWFVFLCHGERFLWQRSLVGEGVAEGRCVPVRKTTG